MTRPNPGDKAPAFSLPADDASVVTNAGLIGRRYVLYFYPRDDTPGCTRQACSLRDNFRRVTATGVEVFGISTDSVKSHAKFRAKYDLPYRLLSDEGHHMAEAYGVWVEKGMMGKSYMGTERTSFVIGPDGRVEHVLPKVKPEQHVDLLMEALVA